mgnify:CR=1 FL=1
MTKICTLEKYIKCTFGIDNLIVIWRNVHGDKLEINSEIWIHIEIWQNTQKISQKDGAISQLIILNDNADVTSLPYLILCYTGPIFYIVNENELRICYNIKK